MIVKNLKLSQDYLNNSVVVSIELVNKTDVKSLQELTGIDILDLTLKKYRKKRSLTANATLWLLLDRLANKLNTTKDEIYLTFLERYGTFTHMIVKPDALEYFKREWRTVREVGQVNIKGQEGIQLQCYYGSSSMNTKEFSRLLTGVIEECEEQNIETITSTEFDRLIKQFEKER